ncbi:MAG: DUF4340 domain-containing protein [Bacteroidota bacterium]
MNRINWLIGIVVVLALGFAALQWSSQGKEKGTHLVNTRDFKVADPTQISKVFLADRKGNQTTLTRAGEDWIINGKYLANENAIKNLLQAVTSIEMQYIPARAAVDNIIKNLATEGILVQVFDQDGQKVKGYYVGGSTADERGTFAILEGADEPYVVHLPGWVGNLRFRFNLVGDDWRSKRVFGEEVEDIERLSIEYPTRRNLSFVLERAGEEYKVAPFYETDQSVRPVPRSRAERYLVKYGHLFVSSYENQAVTERAALRQKIPFAHIRLKLVDGTEKDLKAFARYAERTISVDPKTGQTFDDRPLQGYDLLLNNDEDYAVIQTGDLGHFLVTYDSF